MKLDEATRADVLKMRDELRQPDISDQRVVEIIRVFAALRPGLIQQVAADHAEYRQNRKRLLKVLPMQTTGAA